MISAGEVILSTISGASEKERLLVVLCSCNSSKLELRQQSFAEGIGWFTQSTLKLDPSQVAELRMALGTGNQGGGSHLPKPFRQAKQPAWQPRVVHADSA